MNNKPSKTMLKNLSPYAVSSMLLTSGVTFWIYTSFLDSAMEGGFLSENITV